MLTTMILRWRAMTQIGASAWTLVHRSHNEPHAPGARTLCGLWIPDTPYLIDVNAEVSADAPRCKRCENSVYAPLPERMTS